MEAYGRFTEAYGRFTEAYSKRFGSPMAPDPMLEFF